MSHCPDPNLLATLAAGTLHEHEAAELGRHLDQCEECRELAAALVQSTALEPDAAPQPPSPQLTGTATWSEGDWLAPTGARQPHGAAHGPGTLGPGERIAQFRVLRLIGRGGMGEVYLARDLRLGRKVALKLIAPHITGSSSGAAALVAEAQLTARFSHPNIITIHGAGLARGRPYLVLEYVAGRSLAQRLQEPPPLEQTEILRVGLSAARALAEAHRHEVQHLDLKPSNILLGNDGRVRVLDFGLAHRGRAAPLDSADPNAETVPRGTPRYMAPEQWRGEQCTGAADVWSLGLVLYQLIATRLPYAGTTGRELRRAVLDRAPVPQCTPAITAAPQLCRLVQRCLHKRAAQRPTAAELVRQLSEILAEVRHPAAVPAAPFRGLLPFDEEHASLFLGREAETDHLLALLRDHPVVLLSGSSGAGKSSLVRAGVLPQLRAEGRWIVLRLQPGHDPAGALLLQLTRTLRGRDNGDASHLEAQPAELRRRLVDDPLQLALRLQSLADERGQRLLLVVDQLEEAFTLCDDPRAALGFVEAVLRAADDRGDPVRVLATVRDDFLHRALQAVGAEATRICLFTLRPLSADVLTRTIEQPLRAQGYAAEPPTLPARMVQDVQGRPAELVLLQFAAQQLWRARDRERRLVTEEAYARLGGVAGALARHAETTLEGLSAPQVALVRSLLLRLVNEDGTRRVERRPQLVAQLPAAAEQLLDRLLAARIVVIRGAGTDATQTPEVELAHEALVVAWDRLARWVAEGRQELQLAAELDAAAAQWQQAGRPVAQLWPLSRVTEVTRRLAQHALPIPTAAQAFIDAGRQQARRRLRRRWGAAVAALALLALTALGLAHRARQAERQRMALARLHAEAQAQGAGAALLRGDPLQAAARLRLSLEVQDSTLGRALWGQLSRTPTQWQLPSQGRVIFAVAASADGRQLAVSQHGPGARIFTLPAFHETRLPGAGKSVLGMAFTADGSGLITATGEGRLELWELATQHRTRVFDAAPRALGALATTADGRLLLSGQRDGRVLALRLDDGSLRYAVTAHRDSVRSLALSEDGQRWASGGSDQLIRVHRLRDGRRLATLRGHSGAVTALCFAGGGLWSLSTDRTLRRWPLDLAAPDKPPAGRVVHRAARGMFAMDRHPGGTLVAVGTGDGTVAFFDARTGRPGRTLALGQEPIHLLRFVPPAGQRLLVGAQHGALRLLDHSIVQPSARDTGHQSMVFQVDIATTGERLASHSVDGVTLLWDGAGRALARLQGEAGRSVALRLQPRGDALLWVSGAAEVVQAQMTPVVHTTRGRLRRSQGLLSLAIDAAGTLAVGGSRAGVAAGWTLADGRLLWQRTLGRGQITAAALTGDGGLAALAVEGGQLWLLDGRTGDNPRLLGTHSSSVWALAFSPEGEWLVSGGLDGQVVRWPLRQGAQQLVGRQAGRIYAVAVTRGATRIAACGQAPTPRLWHPASKGQVALVGHTDEVNAIRFSPDGSRLVTAGDDHTVRLWDTESGEPLWWGAGLALDAGGALTHLGWSNHADSRQQSAGWRRQSAHARLVTGGRGAARCLLSRGNELQLWDAGGQQVLARAAAARATDLLATPRGCLLLAGERALWLATEKGASTRLLASGVSSVGLTPDGTRLLLARPSEVRLVRPDGQTLAVHRVSGTPTAVTLHDGSLLVGHADGSVQYRGIRFGDVPVAAVVRLRSGPRGTVIAGFADGTLGLWRARDGQRLQRLHLHGPVRHLALERSRLHALSALGDYRRLDLSALVGSYCELMREVWRRVPVVWDGNQPVARPPPPDHRCAAHRAD